jgi:hypothetical protein
MKWVGGHLAPLLDPDWYANDFKRNLNIREPGMLLDLIRMLNHYPTGQKNASPGNDVGHAEDIRLLEATIQTLLLSYGRGERKSGNAAVTHPLLAMLVASAISLPAHAIRKCGRHDLGEDSTDPKHPHLAYRYRVYPRGKVPEVRSSRDLEFIFRHIGKVEGKDAELHLRAMTRLAHQRDFETPLELKWGYGRYLVPIYQDIWTAFAKGIDGGINLWEIEPVQNVALRERLVERTKAKIELQLPRWRKISWLMAELLLSELSHHFPKDAEKFRKVCVREFEKSQRGYALVDVPRAFSGRVLRQVGIAGSPIVCVYGKEPFFEVEFPYLQDVNLAADLLIFALGARARNLAVAESLLPYNLRNSTILSFESSQHLLAESLPGLVRNYDYLLKDCGLVAGFDRKVASEAALASGNVIAPQVSGGTPPPGNGGRQGLSALLGREGGPALKRPGNPGAGSFSGFGSIPPLEAGPL